MNETQSLILDVAELDLVYDPAPWAFAEARAEEIETSWLARKAALPRLFNGRVLLCWRHEFVTRADGAKILHGGYFATEYKAFLAWRDFGFPDPSVCNCFSMAALQSSDGAFLLGEMADHTANAGSIYFAAGTPDGSDLIDGRIDLDASVRRELFEETGISPNEVTMGPQWTVVWAPPRIACMKVMRMAETAEAIKKRVDAFLAADPNAELRRMHIMRRRQEADGLNGPGVVADFLRHALRDDQRRI